MPNTIAVAADAGHEIERAAAVKLVQDFHSGQPTQPVEISLRNRETLIEQFRNVRARTEYLARPLDDEDQAIQSMPDASPVKWHRAHTTWFWETVVLRPHLKSYRLFNDDFPFLFNSYYESLGPRHPRPQRGLLSRPGVASIAAYRHHVDQYVEDLLRTAPFGVLKDIESLVQLGIAHEEQHQELILMDVLHLFAQSPLYPAYRPDWNGPRTGRAGTFRRHAGGLLAVGDNDTAFAFDNERPRHLVWIEPFEISDRLVTNREWLCFMRDGGYSTARHWLSDGWDRVRAEGWESPLYWRRLEGSDIWGEMTLGGLRSVELDAPVSHISYYEASAFASWADARLPTESEWEIAAKDGILEQVDDVVWQWTQSPYTAYPGYRATADALGEYNGKFMVNQIVLRGGSMATPVGHTRPTYRNFFRAEQRWMFSGLRLARDIASGSINGDTPEPLDRGGFERDVIAGLSKSAKSLQPKYLYDSRGSALFEAICTTPEYYPTRTETALLKEIVGELIADLPHPTTLVEFGSGASEKTRIVLDAAQQVGTYVPIDISATALAVAARRIADAYPAIEVCPIEGDFTQALSMPNGIRNGAVVGFFPGSTVGNFEWAEAVAFLDTARRLLGAHARMIVGADMIKDVSTLIAAYDDAQGVTAQFNLNLLTRANRELYGDFRLDTFSHSAIWNDELKRIEMHLVSRVDQTVRVAGQTFGFAAGESIHTENSHKYSIESFTALCAAAGWTVMRHWISPAPEFGVFLLETSGSTQ